MGCLFIIFGSLFPRFGVLFIWLARPVYFTAAFGNTLLWPILGIIFLPFTTLMYVLLWSSTGLTGFDWFWLALAVILDIGHMGGSAYANRDKVPGYASSV